jgi:hypothetical protein
MTGFPHNPAKDRGPDAIPAERLAYRCLPGYRRGSPRLTAPCRWQLRQGACFGSEPVWHLWRKWLGGSSKTPAAPPVRTQCPPLWLAATCLATGPSRADKRPGGTVMALPPGEMSLGMKPGSLTPQPLTPLSMTPEAGTKTACMALPAVRAGGKSVDPSHAVPWTSRAHTTMGQCLWAVKQGRFSSTDLFLKRQQLLLACTEGLPSPRHREPVTRKLSTRARRCMFHVKLMPCPTEAASSQFGLLGLLEFID